MNKYKIILLIIFLILIFNLINCKNKEKEAWINHTLKTIESGENALKEINMMKKFLENNDLENFNKTKKELLFISDQTKNLVSDNPSQINRLNEINKILLIFNNTDDETLIKNKNTYLKSIDDMKIIINQYIDEEKKLLEQRKNI